jgi:Flp pilus assembly protein TadB
MKHVKPLKAMLSELHAKKHQGHGLKEEEKIKHLIERELHDAQVRHNKAVRNYIILFSLALLLLTVIYIYNPNLPMYVIIINILIALVVFIVGIYLISSGYKRDIKDYITIEEHLDDLKK